MVRRIVETRVIRPGEVVEDQSWRELTPAERIDAVWELTLQCLQWNADGDVQPRLQRSAGRARRPRR